ncbi:uncharacterized protein GLRG_11968 [Colletotrichum graminicola M1.001]|uniref:G-protein coupled receptors family 2 profile 2 domain-containing protein n=1 Tax=Colletotrichum graminicola (strain M1.001 / M2 / FGSC 10212) TaxID=645133 RepID=E3R133_COLGM|nr:uncharacterized protein GLRG_11968 [Colletotrichum graminicola M1.001]EFQ36821.1 hypothetical protein GLRG_11968 [Colletotrichum graminicola M1.001]
MKDNFSAIYPRTTDDDSFLGTIEKISSILSLLGVSLIFVAFWASQRMRSVRNLFILLASVSNFCASIACIIGRDGLRLGVDSALCKAQSVLLESFLQSDPWWSFAMAINVFLIFFANVDVSLFRRYLWVYCIICLGGPLILGLCLLSIKPNEPDTSIYGNAFLWCWITPEWGHLRIFAFYVPTWCCIFGSAAIYLAIGYHVFHRRNQLAKLNSSNLRNNAGRFLDLTENTSTGKTPTDSTGDDISAATEGPVTTIELEAQLPRTPSAAMINSSVNAKAQEQAPWDMINEEAVPQGSPRFGTTSSTPPPPKPRRSIIRRIAPINRKIQSRLKEIDPIKLEYLRTCSLFAVSVLITWTPSSINVLYEYVRPEDVSLGLNTTIAIVLPLQGAWNAGIFFWTSWSTVREEWTEVRLRRQERHLDNHRDRCRWPRATLLTGDVKHRLKCYLHRRKGETNRDQSRDIPLLT